MKLCKVSQAVIFLVIWGLITAFVVIEAYDMGYTEGVESATEIFLKYGK